MQLTEQRTIPQQSEERIIQLIKQVQNYNEKGEFTSNEKKFQLREEREISESRGNSTQMIDKSPNCYASLALWIVGQQHYE